MILEPREFIHLFIHWIVSAGVLYMTAILVPGFRIKNFKTAMIGSLAIGIANIFVRPALLFLTFPLTVITLGFFVFVVNAIILRLCAGILRNFEIDGWVSAIIGALILALLHTLLNFLGFGLNFAHYSQVNI